MDHTLLVKKLKSAQDLREVHHAKSLRKRAVLFHDRGQRTALHKLEHDVELLRRLDDVHVLDDVWVAKLLKKEDLGLDRRELRERVGGERRGEVTRILLKAGVGGRTLRLTSSSGTALMLTLLIATKSPLRTLRPSHTTPKPPLPSCCPSW